MEQPLISQLYPINTLLDEYHQDDVLYRKKIVVTNAAPIH